MIGRLDQIMIEKIFALQKQWLDQDKTPFTISVNVSPIEFSREDFAESVIEMQKKYNVPPHLVELEILESIVTDAEDAIIKSINTLREYGFKINVDDFCAGYSNLNKIASIPEDVIKMDRVFACHGL